MAVDSVTVVDPNQPIPAPTGPENVWAKATGSRDVDFNTRDKYFLSTLYSVYDQGNFEEARATLTRILVKRVVQEGVVLERDSVLATLDKVSLRDTIHLESAFGGEDTTTATLESIDLRSLVKVVEAPDDNEDTVTATLTEIDFRQNVVVLATAQEDEETVSATLTSISLT